MSETRASIDVITSDACCASLRILVRSVSVSSALQNKTLVRKIRSQTLTQTAVMKMYAQLTKEQGMLTFPILYGYLDAGLFA